MMRLFIAMHCYYISARPNFDYQSFNSHYISARPNFDYQSFNSHHPRTLYAKKRDHNDHYYIKNLAILIQETEAIFNPEVVQPRLPSLSILSFT